MFQRIKFEWVVIVIILAIFVFRECSRPLPVDPSADIYADSIKELKSQKAFKAAQFDSVSTVANVLVKEKDSLTAALVKEISNKKIKASKAVEAIPVRVLEENPSVGQALTLLHGVIKDQETLIDTLQSQLAFERNVREQLVALHYDEGKINTNMMEMCEIERIRLQDMNERLQKKAKGKGLFFGIGFGAGWLARSGVDKL
ncbi:MAG TPA: hypothetical protein VLF20_02720 [Patescibacteria group bacterium]|nr:hypothetical protein [Patescibacteria group bacterium]